MSTKGRDEERVNVHDNDAWWKGRKGKGREMDVKRRFEKFKKQKNQCPECGDEAACWEREEHCDWST